MCTLAVFRGVSPAYPVIVAANRDEYLHRPARAPARLQELAQVTAGRDLEAGGTWLGMRTEPDGFFAAGLLNRRLPTPRPPRNGAARSRGLLCLDALRNASVDDALGWLTADGFEAYEPFNLLLIDLRRAVVVDNHDGAVVTELHEGLSVLTNLAVNDPRCPRLASAHAGFSRLLAPLERGAGAEDLVRGLANVLGDHAGSADPSGSDPFARVCVHAGPYGTRSSSILLAARDGSARFFHADDAPCRGAFREVAPGVVA
jgi:uncharacterized protein with NRDE domain